MIPYIYKKILRDGFKEEVGRRIWGTHWEQVRDSTMKALRDTIVVDVDPIRNIIHQVKGPSVDVLPPWMNFYFETTYNKVRTVGGEDPVLLKKVKEEIKDCVYCTLVQVEKIDKAPKSDLSHIWSYTITGITYNHHRQLYLSHKVVFCADAKGQVVTHPNNNNCYLLALVCPPLFEGYKKEIIIDAEADVNAVNNFVRFMQCRNIKAKLTHYPDYKPRKRNRHKVYKYYELVVVKPTVQNISEPHGEGVKGKALHSVRGHISHYLPERPLFGVSGLYGDFFIPQHARGDVKYGKISKTYKAQGS